MGKIEDFLNENHFSELHEIYVNNEWAKGNVTRTTKKWCEQTNNPYNDNVRRRASTILSKGIESQEVTPDSFGDQHQAKILLYDLETSFIEYRGFSLYPNSIPHENITKDWNILSFSYKWLFEDEVKSFYLTPEEVLAGATVHAAQALGLAKKGRIEVGYDADLALWNITRLADLAYQMGLNPIECIMIQGQWCT